VGWRPRLSGTRRSGRGNFVARRLGSGGAGGFSLHLRRSIHILRARAQYCMLAIGRSIQWAIVMTAKLDESELRASELQLRRQELERKKLYIVFARFGFRGTLTAADHSGSASMKSNLLRGAVRSSLSVAIGSTFAVGLSGAPLAFSTCCRRSRASSIGARYFGSSSRKISSARLANL
jgi:hypothetical protein